MPLNFPVDGIFTFVNVSDHITSACHACMILIESQIYFLSTKVIHFLLVK